MGLVVPCGNSQEDAKIRKGVRRMCTLSPYIFNLCVTRCDKYSERRNYNMYRQI